MGVRAKKSECAACASVRLVRATYHVALPAQAQHQMDGGLWHDAVVLEGAAVLELLRSEDEALLVRRDALLVLDLVLHVLECLERLRLDGDGLTREGLDEDLHHDAAVGRIEK